MGRFRIDDPEIDVEALEAQVEARIAGKTGTRYTEGELELLRRAALRPRLERHHLPHGVLEEMPQVRVRLPSVKPPPGSVPVRPPDDAAPSVTHADLEPAPSADINPAHDLYTSGSAGSKGRLVGLLRRLLRPVLRTSSNLEHVLVRVLDEMRRQDEQSNELRRVAAVRETQLREAADRLKDSLDQRIDRTGDWVGGHLSEMTGQLEGRHETQLHLLHNLVYELSYARLGMDSLQDQISELNRHFEKLEARERTLERLAMGGDEK